MRTGLELFLSLTKLYGTAVSHCLRSLGFSASGGDGPAGVSLLFVVSIDGVSIPCLLSDSGSDEVVASLRVSAVGRVNGVVVVGCIEFSLCL